MFNLNTLFRNACIATAGLAVGSSAFAAGVGDAATAAVNEAQSQGEGVGAAVVGCVAALCVVGVVIALVRKV